MKLFIDTANIEEIKSAIDLGIISGVTTNPTIISRENKKFEDVITEIEKLLKDGPIFAEVTSTDAEGMVKDGKKLAAFSKRIVVKIPMCKEGLTACKKLSDEKIPVCMTLVFSEAQGLLAANAGASYIAPFVGRVDDCGWDGIGLVAGMREVLDNFDRPVNIIAASTRNPVHIIELSKIGCDIATVPFKVLLQMIDHPLSTSGLKKFMEDWEKVPK